MNPVDQTLSPNGEQHSECARMRDTGPLWSDLRMQTLVTKALLRLVQLMMGENKKPQSEVVFRFRQVRGTLSI